MSQAVMSAPSQSAGNTVATANHPAAAKERQSFSEDELKTFHDADRGVAKMIVGIMGSIFTIGLALYTVIAILAARGGH